MNHLEKKIKRPISQRETFIISVMREEKKEEKKKRLRIKDGKSTEEDKR